MRAIASALALVLGVGCNAVFDIGETNPVTTVRDSDNDGVFDDLDNCALVENPGQEESDGDALGDACDSCPGVSADDNHDEDLDGRPDGCDDCPSFNDFDDTDPDHDGVGDICDRDSHVTARLRFDPFVTIASAWQGDGDWDISPTDTLGPLAAIGSESTGLALTDVTLSGVEWSVEVGVIATRVWESGDRAGIVVLGASGARTSCTIECTVSDCRLALVVDDVANTPFMILREPFVRLALVVTELDAITKVRSYDCLTGTSGSSSAQRVPIDTSWTPGVVASPMLRASYLDVLQ